MSVLGQVGPFANAQVGPFAMGQVGPFDMGQVDPFAMGQIGPGGGVGVICPGGAGQHIPYKAYAVIMHWFIEWWWELGHKQIQKLHCLAFSWIVSAYWKWGADLPHTLGH